MKKSIGIGLIILGGVAAWKLGVGEMIVDAFKKGIDEGDTATEVAEEIMNEIL